MDISNSKSNPILSSKALNEERLLLKYGYVKDKDLSTTINGELFVACNKNNNNEPVVIKKIPIIDSIESIFQSAVQYIDLFCSATHCYIVIVYNFGANLKEFADEAHKYINNKKLRLKSYQKVIKYLLWSLIKTIHSIHKNVHHIHLGLGVENVLLSSADFIEKDGMVSINPDIEVQFIDFNVSDMNQNKRSKDMYLYGIIAFYLFFGQYPFTDLMDGGYYVVCNGKLKAYLAMENLLRYASKTKLSFLNALLNMDETQRCASTKVFAK
eukprot:145968_1